MNAFEGGQGHVELLTHLRILPGHQTGELGGASADRRERNRTPDRQAVHQHHPALAKHLLAADQVVQRDEHVFAAVRAIHEGRAQWQVTAAYVDARCVGGDQRQADAQVLFLAQQVVRVVGLERQPQQRGDRAERDVAFFPIQTQADHFFALPLTFANDPGVGHGARVRTREWAGERKTRDVIPPGQTWQVMVALLVGAVMQQQLSWAE